MFMMMMVVMVCYGSDGVYDDDGGDGMLWR